MKTHPHKLPGNLRPSLASLSHLRRFKVSLSLASLILLFLTFSAPAHAVEDGQVLYVGGTAPGLEAGALGKLDTTSPTELVFESAGRKLAIPYASVLFYEFTEPVARHLGVLPAIAVGLLRKRQHIHIVRIAYRPENAPPQVAVFEVPKQMPRSLLPILQVRVPRPEACKPMTHCVNANRPKTNSE